MATEKTVNGVPVRAILNPLHDDPDLVQRIAYRKVKAPEIDIVDPDPRWREYFQTLRSRILAQFEPQATEKSDQQQENGPATIKVQILAIDHVGSTAVPKLPAKAVIDIDLVISPNTVEAEAYYVPRLEAAGFQFLLREPEWYGHRFFCGWEPVSCNLHVWGPECPEVERHRIFKEYLTAHDDDRELYARTKVECAAASRAKGENMMMYTDRKDMVVKGILERAFTELGYLPA